MTATPRQVWALRSVLVAAVALAVLATCSPQPGTLERVLGNGVLRVATTNSPTTCYDGPAGPTGYECDLLRGFAEQLGVKLELVYLANSAQVLDHVAGGRVDIGAAGINVTATRSEQVRFTKPVQMVRQQLVYRSDQKKPRDPGDLDGKLAVPQGSSMAERLLQLRGSRYPTLQWLEVPDAGGNDLLARVADGELTYTIANSDLVALNRRHAPKLKVAFDLSGNEDIAWALPSARDTSLYDRVQNYLTTLPDAELASLRDRHFGVVESDEYLGVVRFVTDVKQLLPKYQRHFEDAAERYGLDWRTLAAVGYQESKWNPDAVSFTGVRGIMMLTLDTAAHLKVKDREDPAQSIEGGARYLQQLLRQLPASIAEPDRTWMALAAYNQGLGHLHDARKLAQKVGKNPNRWEDVLEGMRRLSQEQWYSQTKHGYARGGEAVRFVTNVRSYYDVLLWMTGGAAIAPSTEAQAAAIKSAAESPADP
ncbi:membrane-bound lytic murein transglycosylase MltF [Nevskia sp.]|uniref:membrane-bound lytic murein transglycosylase MltF n=1 Tax=Nevskia sp. TaxID=1929292 RepID=UPI0025F3C7B8|nr:membrane-bound lytic murein transglycosylase MltF [Nevskia sp.]